MKPVDLYLSPSQATAYLSYKGMLKQIESFYGFSYRTQVSKSPSFGIFSKTFDYVPDGKVIITGNLVIHYTSKLFLAYLFHQLLVDSQELNTETANQQAEALKKAIETTATNKAALGNTDVLNPLTATMTELQLLTPTQRAGVVKLLNAQRKYTYKGMTVDLDSIRDIPTRDTAFGIEHLNTRGLDLIIKFKRSHELQDINIYDIHFVSSSMGFSVSDASPMLEIYQFVARI